MERGLGRQPGGIFGILDELDRYGDAIAYDLLTFGLRLSDIGTTCSWADVLTVMKGAPRTSAYARARLGADAEWSLTNELLASLLDMTQWYRYIDAGKKGPRPKPIPRPSTRSKGEARTFGRGTSMAPSDFDAWLAKAEGRAA